MISRVRYFFFLFAGKACGVPRDGNVDKKEESELLWTNVVESQSAFLGPNLWDNKTIPYDNDLKVGICIVINRIISSLCSRFTDRASYGRNWENPSLMERSFNGFFH